MNRLNCFCALFRTNFSNLSLIRNVASSQYFSNSASKHNDNAIQTNNIAKKSLQELTTEEQKQLKIFKLEFDVLYSTGVLVPSVMTDENWLHVLQHCHNQTKRQSYYTYLFKIEMSEMNKKAKAQENIRLKQEKLVKLQKMQAEGLMEGFKNRFLLLLLDKTVSTFHYQNIFWHMVNGGQRLVFDFSYENNMQYLELKDLIKQLYASHGLNKVAKEPFVFHFCNLDPNSATYDRLKLGIANLDFAPITVSTDSYLNHYPKDKLVYLTPNANEELTFNSDDVYIIGSLVDKRIGTPVSLAKAKREGIRMAKFPIDKYVKWAQGSKALPLNQVVDILGRLKAKQGWVEALTGSISSRKIRSVCDELEEEHEKMKARKMYKKKHTFSNFRN